MIIAVSILGRTIWTKRDYVSVGPQTSDSFFEPLSLHLSLNRRISGLVKHTPSRSSWGYMADNRFQSLFLLLPRFFSVSLTGFMCQGQCHRELHILMVVGLGRIASP